MSLEFRQPWSLTKICEQINSKDAVPTCVMVCGKDGEAKEEFTKKMEGKLNNIIRHNVQEFNSMTANFLKIMEQGYLVVLSEKESFDFAFRRQLSARMHHAGAKAVIGVYVAAKVRPAADGEDDTRIYEMSSSDKPISIPQTSEFDGFIYYAD